MSEFQCWQKASLHNYDGSIFANVCNYAHYTLYNYMYAYFAGLILGIVAYMLCICENFLLYGIIIGKKCNWE